LLFIQTASSCIIYFEDVRYSLNTKVEFFQLGIIRYHMHNNNCFFVGYTISFAP